MNLFAQNLLPIYHYCTLLYTNVLVKKFFGKKNRERSEKKKKKGKSK
jgi:hypothetical protein